ncbi:MAG: phenylalanine--tRNA ligase subunit beta [Burkholderiales bacterium]|nr:phenylalanine--tRNA ligase subunit beta [Burkholderiales bacterium]
MNVSEYWLRSWVNPPLSTAELAHLLTMSGLEVEACAAVAPLFSGVVVAEVKEVAKHPDADRLTVCRVDAGTGVLLTIVCGAPNVAAAMKVPCALVGAKLPGETADQPFEIKLAKVRGVESQGMLCSARELKLSEDHGGLLGLPVDAPIGIDFRQYAELDDTVFTLKLTPNRADCLSVLGVAREVAALTQTPLKPITIAPVTPVIQDTFPITISEPRGCGRFAGRVIRHLNAKAATPAWIKQRLERAGQRPISALVDVTNYVMLELGQPLHVYDLEKLQGGIDVRLCRPSEKLQLLNEQTVAVYEDVLAIADSSGPIGLAGIMGGDKTKAQLDTRHIFLESAFFFPEAIAGRARRYNVSSDAAHRFERGVDFSNNVAAIERATQLILEICGGKPGPVVDKVARLPSREPVRVRVARAGKVIGVPVTANEMAGIFQRLGFSFRQEKSLENGEAFLVTPPSWRFDLEIEADLVEEVARVYGYENIPAVLPTTKAIMRTQPEGQRSLHEIRERLAAADYQETINFGFVDEAWEADFAGNDHPIRLKNPIAAQMSVMRTTLLGGLMANLQFNLNRKLPRVRVFEVGHVFVKAANAPATDLEIAGYRQPARVAALAFGSVFEEQWGSASRPVDFFDVKGDLESLLLPQVARFVPAPHPALHPGRSARVELEGRPIGWVGELHPRWQHKYELPQPAVVFELDTDPLLSVAVPTAKEVSKFPLVRRDFAILVDYKVSAGQIFDALKGELPAVVTDLALFDIYSGNNLEAGQKSLAFRVLMQDTERTLKDREVDLAMQKIVQMLASRVNAKLRS